MTADLETGEVHHDLLPATIDQRAVPSFSLMEMADALTTAEHLKKSIMRRDVDYGIIPGVKKPSLWKPGAERACQFYGLSHRMERVEIERDKDGDRLGITYKCVVFKVLADGREVPLAECEGYAGYDEDRFWDSEKKWSDKEKRKVAVLDEDGKPKRSKSPWNSVIKMADKRAYVGAVLKATGMSDFFTQDVEDFAANLPQQAPPPPPESPFLSEANVKAVTEKAEAEGLRQKELARVVLIATDKRTDEVAKVMKTEIAALRDALRVVVSEINDQEPEPKPPPPDDTPSDPEPEVEGEADVVGGVGRDRVNQMRSNIDPEDTRPCTPKQRAAVNAVLSTVGAKGDQRFSVLTAWLARPIASSSDLTFSEAGSILSTFAMDAA